VPLLYVTVPVTGVLPLVVASVKVNEVIVFEFIGWLKIAVRALAAITLVAPFAGTVELTAGTGGVVVVKLHVSGWPKATPP
jgi:hypothetical protein